MATFDSLTCRVCDSMVTTSTSTGEMVFICISCGKTRKAVDEDTLVSSGSFSSGDGNLYQYQKMLRYASHQPHNPRPDDGKKCPKCKKGDNVRYIRVGDREKKVYACNCGKKGIDHVFYD